MKYTSKKKIFEKCYIKSGGIVDIWEKFNKNDVKGKKKHKK